MAHFILQIQNLRKTFGKKVVLEDVTLSFYHGAKIGVLGGNEHGVIYKINGTSFSRVDIEPQLAQIFATRNDKVMFIKGDADLDFSLVAGIIDSGHQAGVDNIGILTPGAGRL